MIATAELLARIGLHYGVAPPDPSWKAMLASMHAKQRRAVEDPSKRKCIIGGRRAGKSEAVVYWLAQHWRKFPGKTSLYIALTFQHAKKILWDKLKDFAERWGIPIKFKESAPLEAVFPNGYKIYLVGCENIREVEKARGAHYHRVVVDEVQLFRDSVLRDLIIRVIEPALRDLNGELCLCGTPGYALIGFWYEKTRGPDDKDVDGKGKKLSPRWSCTSMTMWDNPYLPGDNDAYIEEVKLEYGWEDDDPELRREFYGEWVRDDSNLVYPYVEGVHDYDDDDEAAAGHRWGTGEGVKTIIGVDIGHDDGCGFAVAQKRFDSPIIRVPRAYGLGPGDDGTLDVDKIVSHVVDLSREYRTHHIYIDTHGSGAKNILKQLQKILQQHRGVTVHIPDAGAGEAAAGGEKWPKIEYVRTLLRGRNLRIHSTKARELINEYETIPWDPAKRKHREGIYDEVADATMNAVCEHSQRWAEKRKKPQPGTPEYDKMVEKEDDARAQSFAARTRNKSGRRAKLASVKGR